jgi:hypothetical protein
MLDNLIGLEPNARTGVQHIAIRMMRIERTVPRGRRPLGDGSAFLPPACMKGYIRLHRAMVLELLRSAAMVLFLLFK